MAVKEVQELQMHPLETMMAPEGKNYTSSDETIASISPQGELFAFKEGSCLISFTAGEEEKTLPLLVSDEVPTELAKKAIAIALEEWDGEKKLKKSNKYTKWYCKRECEFGWCGGFIGWALDEAGIPLSRWEKAEPVGEEETFGIAEAGVGKILTGYTRMERLTRIPRPGYLTIYGVRKSGNKTVHVGFITDVTHVEGDKYLVSTVEGNIGSRIKLYQYYYDASQEARDNEENIFPIEEHLQTQENVNYTYAVDTWYVNILGQTYQ
ncbi:MAG: hypothetical protein GX786_09505 [Clostridiales bacterium]|nr:hypothetical protein [Clostridiales bacterium]